MSELYTVTVKQVLAQRRTKTGKLITGFVASYHTEGAEIERNLDTFGQVETGGIYTGFIKEPEEGTKYNGTFNHYPKEQEPKSAGTITPPKKAEPHYEPEVNNEGVNYTNHKKALLKEIEWFFDYFFPK